MLPVMPNATVGSVQSALAAGFAKVPGSFDCPLLLDEVSPLKERIAPFSHSSGVRRPNGAVSGWFTEPAGTVSLGRLDERIVPMISRDRCRSQSATLWSPARTMGRDCDPRSDVRDHPLESPGV
jgi:hypothetical protein